MHGLDKENNFLTNIELPLIPNTVQMESTGFTIDKDLINSIRLQLEQKVLAIDMKFSGINLNSPKQLKEYLTKLGYNKDLTTFLVHGQAQSTNKLTLKKLASKTPIAQDILDYREASKLLSTYVNPMANESKWIGNFNQTGTKTGRYSSSKPNLQNIPNRTVIGRQIRQALTAKPGYKLIVSDMAQIEPRLLAFYTKDPKLCYIFQNGVDFHGTVTSDIEALLPKNDPFFKLLPKDRRFVGKTIDLATFYGARTNRLRQELFKGGVDLSFGQVNKLRNGLITAYKGVFDWVTRFDSNATRIGYVDTLLGRRIPLAPGMNPTNTLIQGSCADILKVNMLNLYEFGYIIIASIHDEVVIEIPKNGNSSKTPFDAPYKATPEEDILADCKYIQHIMENSVRLRGIKLVAETIVRSNWCA